MVFVHGMLVARYRIYPSGVDVMGSHVLEKCFNIFRLQAILVPCMFRIWADLRCMQFWI